MAASTSTPDRSAMPVVVRSLGLAVFVFGLATQAAWLALEPAEMRRVLDWGGLFYNGALLFSVAGAALALRPDLRSRRAIAAGAGAVIAIFALAIFSQDLVGRDFGIDQWLVSAEPTDARTLNPGRLAPNTTVALASVGLLLIALELSALRAANVLIPALAFLVTTLGATGVTQHVLGIDIFDNWLDRPRMSLQGAVSLVALSAAFWLRWVRTPAYASVFAGRDDRKLRLVEAGILVLCVFTAAFAAFGSTLRETHRALTRSLSIGLDADIERLHHAVRSERAVLTLLGAQDGVQYALEHADDQAAVAALARVVGSRYWYVELSVPGVQRPLSIGARPKPALEVEFPAYRGSSLLYDGALAFRITVEPRARSGLTAKLTAVVPAPELEALLRQSHVLGSTAALNLCVDRGVDLRCFPSRDETFVTTRSKIARGARAPMALAVAGERGVSAAAHDTRGVPVLAAYAPVPGLGVGAVLKVGSAEIHRPIATQLLIGVPILLGLVGVGVLLLGSYVAPLVRTIVEAERQASNVTRALELKERQTRAIFEGVSDGIVGLSEDSRILSSNPATLRLLGGTSEQLLGRRLTDFIVKRESAVEVLRLCGGIGGGEPAEPSQPSARVVALELKRVDGSLVEADIAIDPIAGDDALVVGVIRDTSRQRYVERMKDEFVATVSHELRTPLTAIRGALQLVMSGIAGPIQPSCNELLKIASGNLERLIQLVNDVLDFEKIAAGKLEFAFRPRDLRGIVLETVNAMRAYGSLQKVELALDPGRERALVLVDGDRLNQALTNLLSNAVKHSPPGGTVRVRVSREEDGFRVSVSDTGKGIPESFRARMFQPFAQADASASRKTGGTGLGLSISKSIIERHRGRIDYISRPGEGTTFFIDLPECRAPRELTASQSSLSPASLKVRLPQVLYVEQELDARRSFAALLGDFAVVTAVAPSSTPFELPEDGPYDVVVLDATRHTRLGSDLVRQAKSVGNSVLVYTAEQDSIDDAVRGLADDVLTREQMGAADLRRRIQELIRNSGRFERTTTAHAF